MLVATVALLPTSSMALQRPHVPDSILVEEHDEGHSPDQTRRWYMPLALRRRLGQRTTYTYQPGSMTSAPNCGAVYMQGIILDRRGRPVDGVTVQLEFYDNRVYRISGLGTTAGRWGFTPLSPSMYHTPVPFKLQLVENERNPIPISNQIDIPFVDCSQAGQFTNITFIED